MADSVTITSGADSTLPDGTKILVDNITTTNEKAQIIKLGVSADGDASVLPATVANGVTVDVTRAVLITGQTGIAGGAGNVGASTLRVTLATDDLMSAKLPATLGQKAASASMAVVLASDQFSSTVESAPSATTMSTSAYASNDVVGTVLTFTSAVTANGRSGRIDAMHILEKTGTQLAPLELWLFNASPTVPADNATWNVSDGDMANCIGIIASGPYYTGTLNGFSSRYGLGLPFKAGGATTSIFGILVTRGTPTYGSTTDLTVKLLVSPDV